jgi:hypothetical protein
MARNVSGNLHELRKPLKQPACLVQLRWDKPARATLPQPVAIRVTLPWRFLPPYSSPDRRTAATPPKSADEVSGMFLAAWVV